MTRYIGIHVFFMYKGEGFSAPRALVRSVKRLALTFKENACARDQLSLHSIVSQTIS